MSECLTDKAAVGRARVDLATEHPVGDACAGVKTARTAIPTASVDALAASANVKPNDSAPNALSSCNAATTH